MKLMHFASAAIFMGVAASLLTPSVAQASTQPTTSPVASTLSGEHGVDVASGGMSLLMTENVEGGQWQYGTRGSKVYSYYWHGSRKHASSVRNGNGDLRRSAETAKKKWAQVEFKKTAWGNRAYYRLL